MGCACYERNALHDKIERTDTLGRLTLLYLNIFFKEEKVNKLLNLFVYQLPFINPVLIFNAFLQGLIHESNSIINLDFLSRNISFKNKIQDY